MLKKYAVLLRMKWVEMFEYRAETVIWLAGAVVQPLIALAVWLGIGDGGEVGGFGTNHLVLYFASLILVERLTTAWDVWELDREIREGTLSFRLLRPLHPIHWAIAENLVYKGVFLILLLPLWFVLAMFVPALQLKLTISQGLAFLWATLMGLGIRFLLGWCVGLLGFWFTRVVSIYGIVEGVSLFFSGRIAPLELLPPAFQQIGLLLPFRFIIYFPVEVLIGKASGISLWYGFLGQTLWLLIFFVLFVFLWQRGMRKYSAVGG